jgi:hypothetical protein
LPAVAIPKTLPSASRTATGVVIAIAIAIAIGRTNPKKNGHHHS